MGDAGVLFRDRADRDRALDMSVRLRGAQMAAIVLLAVPVFIGVPVYGALMVAPLALALVVAVAGKSVQTHVARPEWILVGIWCFGQVMIMASIALADGPRTYLMTLPLVPLLFAAVIWSRRGVVAGTIFTMALLVATALLFAGDEIAERPPRLVWPLILLAMTSIVGLATRDVDMVSRGTAVVDKLTGTLNRAALQARLAELSAQVRITGQQVAMVVVDVDRFKSINDVHGHSTGDAVLREVAGRLEAALGADGPLYRYGGEEFVAVLPGASTAQAAAVAEALRRKVSDTPIAGLLVTASGGVAASTAGEFDHAATFERADAALYTAKAEGRDRVRSAAPPRAPMPTALRRPGYHLRRPTATTRATDRRSAPPVSPDTAPAPDRVGGNWLARSSLHREQIIAVAERTGAAPNRWAFGLLVCGILFGYHWYGIGPLIPPLLLIAPLNPLLRHARRFKHPEYMGLGALLLSVVASGLAVGATTEPALYCLQLILVVIFGACAAYPLIGSWIFFGATAATMAVTALVVDPSGVAENPVILALPVALTGCACILGAALGRSSVDHRSAAIVDQLTGALNRTALEARLPELTHQAQQLREPVSVLVADLDHFKHINDEHGHARGDRVLTEIAARIRSELRAFDAVYRVGGEEFVVLLQGASANAAAEIAERIRSAVERRPVHEIEITISIGVAASRSDVRFDYGDTFARADAALLEAKHAGRNCVVTAPAALAAAAA